MLYLLSEPCGSWQSWHVDLAFDDRVVRRLQDLRARVAVALDAVLVREAAGRRRVRRRREPGGADLLGVGRRRRLVDVVAVDARHVDLAVLADGPVLELPLAGVARQAHRRLLGRGRGRRGERPHGLVLLGVLQVLRRVAVAGLALGALGIALGAVRGHQDRAERLLVAVGAHGCNAFGLRLLRGRGQRHEGRSDRQQRSRGKGGLESHEVLPFACFSPERQTRWNGLEFRPAARCPEGRGGARVARKECVRACPSAPSGHSRRTSPAVAPLLSSSLRRRASCRHAPVPTRRNRIAARFVRPATAALRREVFGQFPRGSGGMLDLHQARRGTRRH